MPLGELCGQVRQGIVEAADPNGNRPFTRHFDGVAREIEQAEQRPRRCVVHQREDALYRHPRHPNRMGRVDEARFG